MGPKSLPTDLVNQKSYGMREYGLSGLWVKREGRRRFFEGLCFLDSLRKSKAVVDVDQFASVRSVKWW